MQELQGLATPKEATLGHQVIIEDPLLLAMGQENGCRLLLDGLHQVLQLPVVGTCSLAYRPKRPRTLGCSTVDSHPKEESLPNP